MPEATGTPATFADIIKHLKVSDTVTKTRRRDLIHALRTMARFFHKEIDQVPANTEWLRQSLRQFHPRQAGVSDKHYANVKSAIIAAIKLAGVGNKREHAFLRILAYTGSPASLFFVGRVNLFLDMAQRSAIDRPRRSVTR
ncbi:MAG: hypothetical protein VCE75_02785 [Alphaproteobacteria bacterium]